MRAEYPDLAVVCYINSTAALKCLSDVCVTSSNAVRIVRALPNRNIFFIPDRNLGAYVKEQVPEKNIILNDGCCPIHAKLTEEQVRAAKELHPHALVLAHPECEPEVLALADVIGSTAEILNYAKTSDAREFLIVTEVGVEYRLRADSPDKAFYFTNPQPICPGMKENTLERLLYVLEHENDPVEVSEEVRTAALRPLAKMLELGK